MQMAGLVLVKSRKMLFYRRMRFTKRQSGNLDLVMKLAKQVDDVAS